MAKSDNIISLISEYIIGTELPKDKNLWDLETLQNWLKFKENQLGNSDNRLERTQNITFFHIVELSKFKNNLNEQVLIYYKSNPYGKKEDFIEATFGYTLLVLEKFININNIYYIPYSTPPSIKKKIYSCDEFFKDKIIDLIIDPTKDIEWYKQYYKVIIELIYKLDFNDIKIELDLISVPNKKIQGSNISFPDYLLYVDKLKLAERLKSEFKIEKGKNIRLLIEALRRNTPPLIAIGARQNKKFYGAMKTFFNRDIGTYQSIFDLKIENPDRDPDFKGVNDKIEFILKSIKKPS